jgi:hypothetical protein
MLSFINGTIESFIAKYSLRAQTLNAYAPEAKSPKPEVAPQAKAASPTDKVEVSPEGQAMQQAAIASGDAAPAVQKESAVPQAAATEAPASDQAAEPNPDDAPAEQAPTVAAKRVRAEAEIRMRMSFSLRTIASAVERLENGELTASEAFEKTRIALSVDMSARGRSVTDTELVEGQEFAPQSATSKLKLQQQAAARYGAESGDFKLRGFLRDAMKIRDRLSVEQQGAHQRVVRQFELRYRFDAKFSLSHLERFNANTEAVNQAAPDQTSGFLAASGALAKSGSNEMVSAFFDAVENYLDSAHDQLTQSVDYFVDAASSQLGELSQGMVSDLEGLLTGRIDAFFGRVEESLSQLESRYLPQAPVPPPPAVEPPSSPAVTDEEKAAVAVS